MVLGRIRAAFLADAPADRSISQLQTSLSFFEGIRRLRRHRWRRRDLQYCVMIPILVFSFCICQTPSFFPRLLFTLGLIYLCTAPAFSQFFLPFMPTGTWLILFYVNRFISAKYRPPIFVRVLPGLETIFYGGDLSDTLAASPNVVCDVLAWIPYGLVHYGAPFVLSLVCFLFGPPGLLPVFHFAFGYMNIAGVIIQLSFPTAPPWYRQLYGLSKASYHTQGSPGGLGRIDKLLGLNLYTGGFSASPLVFGAFPSLHSGSAVMEALFMAYLFPSVAPIVGLYVMWIWWSTMYLTHHYFIDLIGGAMLTIFVFSLCQITILPQRQPGKFGRWSYSYVKCGLSGIRQRALPDFRRSYDEEAPPPMYEDTFEMSAIPRAHTPISRSGTPRPKSLEDDEPL